MAHSCILHVPRTGGTYIRELLKYNKVESKLNSYLLGPLQPRYTFDTELIDMRTEELNHRATNPYKGIKPTIYFVRDPLTWYPSMFSARLNGTSFITRWNSYRPFDLKCSAPNFTQFIENVRRAYPTGFLANLYFTYGQFSDTVGKMESLFESISDFILEHEGIKLKELDKRINVSYPIKIKREDVEFIKEYESTVRSYYGYAT